MMQKILIDSDVCLDFITGRKPYAGRANKLFWTIENSSVSAVVSPESFSNMFYILQKFHSASAITSELSSLRTLVDITDLSGEMIDWTLNAEWKDFEDAIQYQSAVHTNCDAIVTRNTSDFKKSSLPVFTPFEFLEHFEE